MAQASFKLMALLGLSFSSTSITGMCHHSGLTPVFSIVIIVIVKAPQNFYSTLLGSLMPIRQMQGWAGGGRQEATPLPLLLKEVTMAMAWHSGPLGKPLFCPLPTL